MKIKATDNLICNNADYLNTLWSSILKNNSIALSSLYNLCYEMLLDYGTGITSDDETVQDSIQELFMYVWEHRENLEEVASIKSYLLVSLRRNIFRKIKAKRAISQRNRVYIDDYVSVYNDTVSLPDNNYRKALFRSAFNILSDRQKQMIRLRFFEGLSTDEIASFLGVKRQSVYNCISSAIGRMNSFVSRQYY